jgi:transposase, IS5 family
LGCRIAAGVKQANNAIGQLKLDRLRHQIDEMVPA